MGSARAATGRETCTTTQRVVTSAPMEELSHLMTGDHSGSPGSVQTEILDLDLDQSDLT